MGKKFDELSQQYENFSNNLHPLSLSLSSNAQDELDDIRLSMVDVVKNESFDLQEVYSSEEEHEKVKPYSNKFIAQQNIKFMEKTTTANAMTITQKFISVECLNQARKGPQVKNMVYNQQKHQFKMNKIEVTNQTIEIHQQKQTQNNGKTVNFSKFILNKTNRHIQLLYTAKIITQSQKDELQEAAKTNTDKISGQLPLNLKKHITQYQRSSQIMRQILKSECEFKRKILLLKNCLKFNKKQKKSKKVVKGNKMEVIEQINPEQCNSN